MPSTQKSVLRRNTISQKERGVNVASVGARCRPKVGESGWLGCAWSLGASERGAIRRQVASCGLGVISERDASRFLVRCGARPVVAHNNARLHGRP